MSQYDELRARRRDRTGDGYHYTPKALALFPRYNVAAAILEAVETLAPERLGSVEEVRKLLLMAGSADNDFTRDVPGAIESRVMEEEREAYAHFISAISLGDLEEVAPLPYRRVLSAAEALTIRSELGARWKIKNDYWFPLTETSIDAVVAFRANAFEDALPASVLQSMVRQRGTRRVWEVREHGPQYECDLELFEPVYTGAEGYWSAPPFDWIVYASHENSITVGGWWLIDQVRLRWPAWRAHEWC